MPRNYHAKNQRSEIILEMLAERDHISVQELVQVLSVSAVTIRKDLAALEGRGLLRRTHGGAIPITPINTSYPVISQSFNENEMRYRDEKQAIAAAAAALVADGQTVAFTGGTTATAVARALTQTNLTIVTNAINIALDLSHKPGTTIFVPGGFLRGGMYSLVSVSALDRIRNFTIDTMFIGVNGLHPERGLTELLKDQAVIHRGMIDQTKKRIVVADHSKLGMVYKAHMCDIDEMHLLVTDSAANPDQVAALREKGLAVLLAPPISAG